MLLDTFSNFRKSNFMIKNEIISFNKMRSAFFFGMIAILSVAMLYLFGPFFYPIFWAAVIAVMFYPHYQWLNTYLKMPNLNAAIMVGLVILTIFIPLVLIFALLVNQIGSIYSNLDLNAFVKPLTAASDWLQHTPAANLLPTSPQEWSAQAVEFGNKIGGSALQYLSSFTQNSFTFLFNLFLMFYTLFFFFRDGEKLLKRLMHLSPLGEKYEIMLYEHFTSTARATLKSTLIVGTIQGTLGGIMFWITGVPGALVWAVIMIMFSIIPAFGSFVIWLPAGLIMLALGNIWQGITILAVGTFVISTIDNLLRPPLIGKDIQMHPLLVLFSTLGGIFLFGISGFVIGPILASLYLATMSIYDHYYKTELDLEHKA